MRSQEGPLGRHYNPWCEGTGRGWSSLPGLLDLVDGGVKVVNDGGDKLAHGGAAEILKVAVIHAGPPVMVMNSGFTPPPHYGGGRAPQGGRSRRRCGGGRCASRHRVGF